MRSILVATIAMLLALPAWAQSYYLSPSGSDSGACSVSAPCLTISRAQTVTRAAIAGGMASDVYVNLRAGKYRPGGTFGAADAGRNGHTITWRSYNGEAAVITGGAEVSGWVVDTGSVYKAPLSVGSFRQLYINGMHATRARSSANPTGWTRTGTGYTMPDSTISSYGNPTRIQFVSFGNWSVDYTTAASFVGTAATVSNPAFSIENSIRVGYSVRATPNRIENARELLDAAGEWYYDLAGGYVYLWPPSGTMTGTRVTIPTYDQLLVINGSSGLVFKDLSFAYSNWDAPSGVEGYVGLQSGDRFVNYTGVWAPANYRSQPGAVEIRNSSNVTFTGNTIAHTGSRSVLVASSSSYVEVSKNLFEDNASGQIQIGDGLEFVANRTSHVTVSGNLVSSNNGWDYPDAGPIYTSNTDASTFANNSIFSPQWTGISANFVADDADYITNTTITRNQIRANCRTFLDCGGIYLRDTNGVNITANDVSGPQLAGSIPACIYFDFFTSTTTSAGNVCRASDRWLNASNGNIDHITAGPDYSDTATSNVGVCTACTVNAPTAISAGPQKSSSAAWATICAAGVKVAPGAAAGMSRRYGYVTTFEGRRIPWRPCADNP